MKRFLCGVLAALMLVWLIAALQGRENTLVLILSGIIMSGFFAALVSLMQYMADTEETLPNIVFWLLGSFATANWHKVLMLALPVSIVSLVLLRLRWRINLLALEEKDALALGVPLKTLRRSVLVCCALLVSSQVAVSGSIGGIPAISAVCVIFVGILGAVFGHTLLNAMRIRTKAARGLAMGTASHALGTARCAELDYQEGAFSSLALVICGIITSLVAPFLFPIILAVVG